MEIHVLFSFKNINYDLKGSIHQQYEKHFGRPYILQNNIDIEHLLSLKRLNLRTSKPIKNLSFLQFFNSIEELTIYSESNEIIGLESIGTIGNLKQLFLYLPKHNKLDFLSSNFRLKELSLITGNVDNYSFFSSLSELQKLMVSIDTIEKNHPIFQLIKIEELDIGNCSLVVDLNDFSRLVNLKQFTAYYLTLNSVDFLKSMNLNKLNARKGDLTLKEVQWLNENIEHVLLL